MLLFGRGVLLLRQKQIGESGYEFSVSERLLKDRALGHALRRPLGEAAMVRPTCARQVLALSP